MTQEELDGIKELRQAVEEIRAKMMTKDDITVIAREQAATLMDERAQAQANTINELTRKMEEVTRHITREREQQMMSVDRALAQMQALHDSMRIRDEERVSHHHRQTALLESLLNTSKNNDEVIRKIDERYVRFIDSTAEWREQMRNEISAMKSDIDDMSGRFGNWAATVLGYNPVYPETMNALRPPSLFDRVQTMSDEIKAGITDVQKTLEVHDNRLKTVEVIHHRFTAAYVMAKNYAPALVAGWVKANIALKIALLIGGTGLGAIIAAILEIF